ncbi:diaminopimelate epimerase [Wigglesworthia glossinidia endosymbiont of Glossina morsitans morsitans (Yale colony)]|uniref:Diaminopimelate epimerase n=2 Tax=Wigglesworthia glossinidia TaxID=51229 RepID=H6Q546_WIGGL|nr:diaminopimelate epimerase [Wigglesworthia glossinidia endosymbiont of Glossina morsitans morsitans (Yale colony)]
MKFSKMHSIGNDFILIDAINQKVNLSKNRIVQLSNRYSGIGFDQLIIVMQSYDEKIDFYIRIFNSDASEAVQCINGIRCVFKFLHLKNFTQKNKICIGTHYNKSHASLINQKLICVRINSPKFKKINANILKNYHISMYQKYFGFLKKKIVYHIVYVENLHCVIFVKNFELYIIKKIAPILSKYILFPNVVNVSFSRIINFNNIELRVYERGVGSTYCCGSAAAATVAVGIHLKKLNHIVTVNFLRGNLQVSWKNDLNLISIIGPAEHIYEGYIF